MWRCSPGSPAEGASYMQTNMREDATQNSETPSTDTRCKQYPTWQVTLSFITVCLFTKYEQTRNLLRSYMLELSQFQSHS